MDKLLKHFQDTESPINWLISQIVEDQIIKSKSVGEWEIIFQEARQKEVDLIQKTIDRTLLVYKELKRD